ncbi:MAG: type II toxin-antitoxin system RelE/ParE family toxin [Solirubrobacterales bacterium]|nr:type II toxin-antitoxin system RelE/ParE family toxin [Solirubrobacterales bacterium]
MAADKRKSSRKRERRPSGPVEPGAARDPGPPYVVVWHPEAANERDESWPAREKVAMLHAAQKLEATGPRLGHPHSSAVQGEVGQGLRELRPRAGRSRWRPIYRRVTPSTFVIFAVGPEAEIDSRGYKAAVVRAVERLAQLELD